MEQIKIGSRVRILRTRAKDTWWEYGQVAEIRDNEVLINYGTQDNPIYGIGIWVKQSNLEVIGV